MSLELDKSELLKNKEVLTDALTNSTVNGLTNDQIAEKLGVPTETPIELVNGKVTALDPWDQLIFAKIMGF